MNLDGQLEDKVTGETKSVSSLSFKSPSRNAPVHLMTEKKPVGLKGGVGVELPPNLAPNARTQTA